MDEIIHTCTDYHNFSEIHNYAFPNEYYRLIQSTVYTVYAWHTVPLFEKVTTCLFDRL